MTLCAPTAVGVQVFFIHCRARFNWLRAEKMQRKKNVIRAENFPLSQRPISRWRQIFTVKFSPVLGMWPAIVLFNSSTLLQARAISELHIPALQKPKRIYLKHLSSQNCAGAFLARVRAKAESRPKVKLEGEGSCISAHFSQVHRGYRQSKLDATKVSIPKYENIQVISACYTKCTKKLTKTLLQTS